MACLTSRVSHTRRPGPNSTPSPAFPLQGAVIISRAVLRSIEQDSLQTRPSHRLSTGGLCACASRAKVRVKVRAGVVTQPIVCEQMMKDVGRPVIGGNATQSPRMTNVFRYVIYTSMVYNKIKKWGFSQFCEHKIRAKLGRKNILNIMEIVEIHYLLANIV